MKTPTPLPLPGPLELALRMAPSLPRRIRLLLLARLPAENLDEVLAGVPLAERVRRELGLLCSGGAQAVLEMQARGGLHLLLPGGPHWPALLDELPDPPTVLFARGCPGLLERDAIGVVGTRKPDHRACRLAFRFGETLAGLGLLCVSGGALGVDREAHLGAGPARTCAVLGCGLDRIWPRENRPLLEAIGREGLLLSEYPPDFQSTGWTFPRRNRLISGLGRAVVVIQAAARSGALITARCALEQDRELWVCAGPAESPGWEGNHSLVRAGARLLGGRAHLLEELAGLPLRARLEPQRLQRVTTAPSDPEGHRLLAAPVNRRLLDLLDPPPTLDLLALKLGIPAGELSGILLELDLAGLVRRLPGERWARL
jgi:DNA processing protein